MTVTQLQRRFDLHLTSCPLLFEVFQTVVNSPDCEFSGPTAFIPTIFLALIGLGEFGLVVRTFLCV